MDKGRTIFVVLAFAIIHPGQAQADLQEFEYPELAVVPRASDRLKMEASKEEDRQWTTFLPVQVSARIVISMGDSFPSPDARGAATEEGTIVWLWIYEPSPVFLSVKI